MNIYILIPVYKRGEIFEKVLIRLNEIRELSKLKIGIVVAGEKDDVCYEVFNSHKKEHDVFIAHKNLPVSNKFNGLFKYLEDKEFDYAMIVGSDDLISNKAWKLLEKEIVKYETHFIGFKDLNFYDTKTKRVGYFICKKSSYNQTIGCFRTLHYNLIKALNFEPYYNGKDSGIDFSMEEKIKYINGVTQKEITVGNTGEIVDLKSNVNINSYEYLKKIFTLASLDTFPNEIKQIL